MRFFCRFIMLSLLALAGCPTSQRAERTAAKPAPAPQSVASPVEVEPLAALEFPQPAFEYLLECLKQADQPNDPLSSTVYEVLANLPPYPELLAPLLVTVEANEPELPLQLVAAWLAQEPSRAVDFVVDQTRAGNPKYLAAAKFNPQAVRTMLSRLDLLTIDQSAAGTAVGLLRDLPDLGNGPRQAADLKLLNQLATREDNVRWRAIGQLLALNAASTEQRQQLIAALQASNPETVNHALEGVRVSADGSLAQELIPLIVDVPLNDVPAKGTRPQHVLVASALVSLPGNQASVMRQRLLKAQDHLIVWRACLGELLNGNPAPWDDRVEQLGSDNMLLWTCLEVAGFWQAELLPTLAWAAASDDWIDRQRAAYLLNRTAASASNPEVWRIQADLLVDPVHEVRQLAWISAGRLQLRQLVPQALAVVEDPTADARIRLVAAYQALACAEVKSRGVAALEN